MIIALWIVGDYGISTDEPALTEYGEQVRTFFLQGVTPQHIDWSFFTPFYPLLMAWMSHIFGTTSEVWMARHLLSFAVYSIGWWSLFFLARRATKSGWWALFTIICFTLTPRIFAHAFYNPKDIPTLSFFAYALLSIVRFVDHQTVGRALVAILLTALTITFRPVGYALIPLGLFLIATAPPQLHSWRRSLAIGIVGIGSVAVATVALWPLLWTDTVHHALGAIRDNIFRGDKGLYLGSYIHVFPWHYLPVWMAITIPAAYIYLWSMGCVAILLRGLRHPRQILMQDPLLVVAMAWCLIPITIKILSASLASGFLPSFGVFNDWRHLYFIYPAFLIIAGYGASWLWSNVRGYWRMVLMAIIVCNLAATLAWMVRWHPMEYVYFSVPSSWVKGQMETDYWGLSYFQGLQWVMAHDQSERITVYVRNGYASNDWFLLPPEGRARLILTATPKGADYILDTLRASFYVPVLPDDRLVHTIDVDGLPILWIYRGPSESNQLPAAN